MTDPAIEAAARKEIERSGRALAAVRLAGKDARAEKVLLLARSYLSDGGHFLSKGKFIEAFEAAVICWGYLDAGLHLGALKLSDESAKEIFTV